MLEYVALGRSKPRKARPNWQVQNPESARNQAWGHLAERDSPSAGHLAWRTFPIATYSSNHPRRLLKDPGCMTSPRRILNVGKRAPETRCKLGQVPATEIDGSESLRDHPQRPASNLKPFSSKGELSGKNPESARNLEWVHLAGRGLPSAGYLAWRTFPIATY